MKYYADYWNESVYSVTPEGETDCKFISDKTGKMVERHFKRPNDAPWMWEENGVGDFVEPMIKEEFESFGKTWIWDNAPNEDEQIKHSWRNYIKRI